MKHADFRRIVETAWMRRRPGVAMPLGVLQATQVVSFKESGYGQGWKPPGNGSNNTGAVQAPKGTPENSFEYNDTHPNPDGTSTTYTTRFKKYASLEDGVYDQIGCQFANPETLQAAINGSLWGVSAGMRKSGYYEGKGATQEDRIRGHFNWIRPGVIEIAQALNEPVMFYDIAGRPPPSSQTAQQSFSALGPILTGIGLMRWLL